MRGGKRENAGRPKGTPNKKTEALRANVNMLIDDNWDSIQEDIKSLSSKDRVDTIIKLLEYSLPKLNRTEITDNLNIDKMTPNQRKARIKELSKKLNIV
ncbi:hypothetical protein [Maribacter sp. Hel_I_7]|uniref:hypothetical protein n=1 Tax=Maribacter sp. Hel_I_7 TaxID=1249997 RepID=UPI0006895853|nr:hypothetical protein [Maribacter sp. Hel_I_7]